MTRTTRTSANRPTRPTLAALDPQRVAALAAAAKPDERAPHRYWGSAEVPTAKADFFSAVVAPVAEDSDATVATIRMYGPIDSYGGWWGISTDDVSRVLDALPDTVEQIVLRINSPGGEVWEAMAILNMLRAHRARIIAVADGLAASAASFIAAGCDETVMSPGSQMMIHSPSSIAWGNAGYMRKRADFLDTLEASMVEVYTAKAGEQDWATLLAEETWLTAAQTVELGLADRVDVVPDAGVAATVGEEDEPDYIFVTVDPDEDDDDPDATARVRAAAASARAAVPAPPSSSEPEATPTATKGVPTVSEFNTEVRAKLGLPTDATDDEVLAKLAEPAPAAKLPEGVVQVDQATFDTMRADATAGRAAHERQQADERKQLVTAAVLDGRIPPARADHWESLLKADPEGTGTVLAGLAAGTIPVDERGITGGIAEANDEDTAYSRVYPTAPTTKEA